MGLSRISSRWSSWVPNSPNLSVFGLSPGCLFQFRPALENLRKSVEMDPSMDYPRFRIWLIRSPAGRTGRRRPGNWTPMSNPCPAPKRRTGLQCIGLFLTGQRAGRTSSLTRQPPQPNVRVIRMARLVKPITTRGMKRLLGGDKEGAAELFSKVPGYRGNKLFRIQQCKCGTARVEAALIGAIA